jgi:hypothetical protein
VERTDLVCLFSVCSCLSLLRQSSIDGRALIRNNPLCNLFLFPLVLSSARKQHLWHVTFICVDRQAQISYYVDDTRVSDGRCTTSTREKHGGSGDREGEGSYTESRSTMLFQRGADRKKHDAHMSSDVRDRCTRAIFIFNNRYYTRMVVIHSTPLRKNVLHPTKSDDPSYFENKVETQKNLLLSISN